MKKLLRSCASVLAMAAGIGMVAGDALATEGYFQHAYGLRHKALAGAGVASIEDATGISINPAGLVGIGNQFNMGMSLFMPFRKYTATGTLFVNPGTHKSKKNLFPVPTMAYVRQLDADSAIAFSIFGNGGMNTTWKAVPNTSPFCGGAGQNPFCGSGKAGVDLMQMFISGAYARRLTDGFSIGIAPLFAIQRFKAYGLQAFAGFSSDPANFTNRGYSYSYGGGVRLGVTLQPSDMISIGASYQTKIWMSKFKKYRGLFENGGDFDIPANLQVGVAFRPTPDLKLMVDYRRIFNSGVDAISNSSRIPLPFGVSGGPGFGWRDTNTIKVGLEYQVSPDLILRAGYAYIWPNPVRSRDITLNLLAPGVIRHEITGGGTYRVDANNDIDFAFMFAPTGKQSGQEVTVLGPTPGSKITAKMYQLEVSLGWTYNFGAGSTRAR